MKAGDFYIVFGQEFLGEMYMSILIKNSNRLLTSTASSVLGWSALFCIALFGASATFAQAQNQVLEEIVVTAQKRAQRMQDVPIAGSALDSLAMTDANIVGIDQLAPQVPGLFFQFFDDTRPSTFIRGLGSRQFDAGSEGSVGIFFDEMYLGRFSGQMTGLFDLERVEVLKGPQGTLFGRNTIGGTLNIISKKPTDTFDAYIETDIGNFDQVRVEGAVGGPIGDSNKVFGRLAVLSHDRDGHIDNLTTGTELQGEDTQAARGSLRFLPTDRLEVNLIFEYNESDRPGTQGEPIVGVFSAAPGITLEKTPDRRDEFFNFDSRFDREVTTAIARVDWDAGPVSITSVTGFRGIELAEFRDLDSTRFDTISQDTIEDSDALSQEIRFVSNPGGFGTFDDRLEWVLGVYYYNEETDRSDRFPFGPDSAISSIMRTFDEIGVPAPILPGVDTFNEDFIVDVETESIAVFGQATWALTDRLNLTGGLRWTEDEKTARISGRTTRPGLPPIFGDFDVDLSPSWDSVDPKVTLDYHINNDILVFATFSEGFKSGGFQFAAFNPGAASQVFDPEELTAYELGLKSTLWNGRAQLNVSSFYYDYEDQQLPRIVLLPGGSFGQVIDNAAESSIKGVEIDATIVPIEGLQIKTNYAYLDATFDDFVFDQSTDFSDNRMPRSPENTFNIGIRYDRQIGPGTFFVNGNWSWQDTIFFEFDEGLTTGTEQGPFSLFNAEVGYNVDNWRFSIWGKNLDDTEYRNSVLNFGGNTIEFLGLPRTYGVTARYNLN